MRLDLSVALQQLPHRRKFVRWTHPLLRVNTNPFCLLLRVLLYKIYLRCRSLVQVHQVLSLYKTKLVAETGTNTPQRHQTAHNRAPRRTQSGRLLHRLCPRLLIPPRPSITSIHTPGLCRLSLQKRILKLHRLPWNHLCTPPRQCQPHHLYPIRKAMP